MNYQLSFLDNQHHIHDVWQANFESEHTAICWMWIVGGVLKHDWSIMELWCRRCRTARVDQCPRSSSVPRECCIAPIPAKDLRPSCKSERQQPRARPIILIVERDDVLATSHESSVVDAGFSVGASWPDSSSAGRWLNAHNPDAAILDVKLQDKACVELAEKLTCVKYPLSRSPAIRPTRRALIEFSGLCLGWESLSPPPGCSWHCAASCKADGAPDLCWTLSPQKRPRMAPHGKGGARPSGTNAAPSSRQE